MMLAIFRYFRHFGLFIISFFAFAEGISFHCDTLSNGIVILSSEAHKIPLIEARVIIRAGSVFDPPGLAGLANLTNQMLIRGTTNRSGDEIIEAIEAIGGEISPISSEDYTGLSCRVISKDLKLLIDIMSDCLLNPLFDSLELIRLKKEVISMISAHKDDPFYLCEEGFRQLVFGEHPLTHLPVGFDSTVKKITIDDLKDFYEDYYQPQNTFMVFIGDFERDSLLGLLERSFLRWKGQGLKLPSISQPVRPDKILGRIIKKDISQAYIMLGFLGPGYYTENWHATRLMNYILGGAGLSSWIGRKIREEKGLAYIAHSYFKRFANGGYYVAEVQTRNEMANEVIAILIDEIRKMHEGQDKILPKERKGMQGRVATTLEKELERAKKYYIGNFPLTFNTYREIAALAVKIEIEQLGPDYPARFEELIEEISLADIRSAAQKYLFPDRFCLLIVGNIKKEDITVKGIEWIE